MDVESLRNNVKTLATDAVKCDKLEEYEKAYDLYVKAANQLQTLIKYDQNPYSKKDIQRKSNGLRQTCEGYKRKKIG